MQITPLIFHRIISFTFHIKLSIKSAFLSPLCRRGQWNSKTLSKLPKVIHWTIYGTCVEIKFHAPDALPLMIYLAHYHLSLPQMPHPNLTFCSVVTFSSNFASEFQGVVYLFLLVASHPSVLLQSLILYSVPLEHQLQMVHISFSSLLSSSANY